jgi:hypothetical protein
MIPVPHRRALLEQKVTIHPFYPCNDVIFWDDVIIHIDLHPSHEDQLNNEEPVFPINFGSWCVDPRSQSLELFIRVSPVIV